MSEPLIIWLPEDLDETWAYYQSETIQGWIVDDDDRKKVSQINNGACTVICPGTWFRSFGHSLPDMKSSDRLAAAGFAIEEKLAAPLEEQHIVVAGGDEQRIGVIEKDLIEKVMTRLSDHNLTPLMVIPEYEAFPSEMDQFITMNRAVQPGPMGYSMDADDEGHNPLALIPLMDLDGALNYAQGEFSRKHNALPKMRAFGSIAAALTIAGFSWLLWQGAQARAMQTQADTLIAEAGQLYADATGKPVPSNPASTILRQVRRGGETQADFMTLSAQFFNGLKEVDGVFVETLRYNEDRGQLTLKLIYPSFETAARLEQIFQSSNGDFKSGAVRDQNGELIGEGVFKIGGGS